MSEEILIVDDNADIRSILKDLINYAGGLKSTSSSKISIKRTTPIDKRSNNFTDYQQIYNELMRPLPSRKDELSEYLDELDKEFKK